MDLYPVKQTRIIHSTSDLEHTVFLICTISNYTLEMYVSDFVSLYRSFNAKANNLEFLYPYIKLIVEIVFHL